MPNRERLLERACVLHQKAARLVGLEEPFVRVQTDRIGALDPAQEFLAFLGHSRKAAICGVDMQPDVLRLAVVRHRLERVDGPGAGRSGVGAHRDGIEPGGAILGHRSRQRIHVQAETIIARKQPYALGPNTDDPGRTDVRTVALVAHVHGRPLGMTRALPSRDEGIDAGCRAAAREKSAGALGIA